MTGTSSVLPVADRHAARRPDPHRAVQLGVRPPHRRGVRVPAGGHRRRTGQRGKLSGAAGCAALARAGLRRRPRDRWTVRAVPAVGARRDLPRRGARGCWRRARRTRRSRHQRKSRRGMWRRAETPSWATTTSTATSPTQQRAAFLAEGRRPVLRLRMPDEDITWHDLVRGDTTFAAGTVPDFALTRASGDPLYTLVNPVDDALMKITHVLRGEDLLPSTPRQIALYQALIRIGVAERVPEFAHLPSRSRRGQQEAVQARPAVQPVPAPRARLHPRGPAELPGAAGLGHRRRSRRVQPRRNGGRVRRRRRQLQPRPVRPEEGRRAQRRTHPAAEPRTTSPHGCARTSPPTATTPGSTTSSSPRRPGWCRPASSCSVMRGTC